jgi:hypothetical protein
LLNHPAKQLSRTKDLLLTHELVEGSGPQPVSKRLVRDPEPIIRAIPCI